MQKIKILAALICFFFQSNISISQTCGTIMHDRPDFDQRAFEAFRSRPDFRNEKDKVGITIWVVETTTGSAGISIETIENELKKVNAAFFTAGIEFFLCGSQRIIQGAETYNYNSGDNLHGAKGIPGTINVYYADEVLNNAGSSLCGYAQFPWAGKQEERYIMMAKGCADNGATLAHELGHFFGLLHTHETALGIELADGSNCSTAGDLLCDTPADPLLGGFNVAGNCAYVGQEVDTRGLRYSPQPNNIMSYAPSTCRRLLTSDQSDLARFYNEGENSYLIDNCDFYPDYAVDFNSSSLSLKSGQQLSLDLDFEKFNVQEQKDIEVYFYMSADAEDRGIPFHKETVTVAPGEGKSVLTFDLEVPVARGTGQYFLSVIFDATYKVLERTKRNNVASVQAVIDNTALGEMTLFPNPAQDHIKVFLKNRNEKREVKVQFFNFAGQLLDTQESYKNENEFLRRYEIGHLPDGTMLVSLLFVDTGERYTYKFVKQTY